MNIYELQHRFNLEMEKHGVTDPVMSTIIEDYINYAYQNYVTEKYDSLVNNIEKFEITERISRILAGLLSDYSVAGPGTSITTNSSYGYYVATPGDLQYIVAENADINYTDCNGTSTVKRCRIIPIKHNMISANLDNPFIQPYDNEIWRVNNSSGTIELVLYSGVMLNTYRCRYIKKQTPVNFNPVAPATGEMEIDSSVHEEVVVRAAYMYLASLNNNKKENNAE